MFQTSDTKIDTFGDPNVSFRLNQTMMTEEEELKREHSHLSELVLRMVWEWHHKGPKDMEIEDC